MISESTIITLTYINLIIIKIMAERLVMGGDAAKHVAAYLEYDSIVGNADGGRTFTPKEYEEYK